MVIEAQVMVKLPGNGKHETVTALFDTGSTHTFIQKDLADRLGLETIHHIRQPVELFGEDQGVQDIALVHAAITVDTCEYEWLFGVRDKAPYPVVVGNDLMRPLDMVLREAPQKGEKKVETRRCGIRL